MSNIIKVSKGMKDNRLVHIIHTDAVGKIIIPTSMPETLIPYLPVIEQNKRVPK